MLNGIDGNYCGPICMRLVLPAKLHVAAYLPPLYERTLRWREAPAGDRISPDDRKQFSKTGFKTRPGMAIWDTVRELEHILKAGLGKSLKHFQLSCLTFSKNRNGGLDCGMVAPCLRHWVCGCLLHDQ